MGKKAARGLTFESLRRSARPSSSLNGCLSAIGMLFLILISDVSGQQFSTVQLPTYQTFSMGTTVLVPDQGSIYAGGVGRSSHRRSRRTGSTSGVSAGGVTVSAFVHDLAAMDAAILEQARLARQRAGRPLLTTVPNRITRVSTFPDNMRISDVRRQIRANEKQRLDRAQADFDLAQRLIGKGKIAPARIMLQNALTRADDSLRATISEQLAELDQFPDRQRIASR